MEADRRTCRKRQVSTYDLLFTFIRITPKYVISVNKVYVPQTEQVGCRPDSMSRATKLDENTAKTHDESALDGGKSNSFVRTSTANVSRVTQTTDFYLRSAFTVV